MNSTSGLSHLTTIYVRNFIETALDLLIHLRIISLLSSHPKYKTTRGKYFHILWIGTIRHESQKPKFNISKKKKKFNISMSKRLSVGWDKDDSYLQYIKIVH